MHAYANLIFIICIQTHSKRLRSLYLPPQIKSNRAEIYCLLWIICVVRHSSRNRALWLYHLEKKLQIPHWDIIIIIIFIIVVAAVAIVVISLTMNCGIRNVWIIQPNLSRFAYFLKKKIKEEEKNFSFYLYWLFKWYGLSLAMNSGVIALSIREGWALAIWPLFTVCFAFIICQRTHVNGFLETEKCIDRKNCVCLFARDDSSTSKSSTEIKKKKLSHTHRLAVSKLRKQ